MTHEVKHCVLDEEDGSLILCDACFLGDERRFRWEGRGDLVPKRWGRSGRR
jgi:hypothetical protein